MTELITEKSFEPEHIRDVMLKRKRRDLRAAYIKIGNLKVKNRLLNEKLKKLEAEGYRIPGSPITLECPFCGTTELLCGYPSNCSSSQRKKAENDTDEIIEKIEGWTGDEKTIMDSLFKEYPNFEKAILKELYEEYKE